MVVTPNKQRTGAAGIALSAQNVEVIQTGEASVEVSILRPDGGTTTVAVFSPDGSKVVTRLIGHEDDSVSDDEDEDSLPAEQEVKPNG